MRVEIKPSEKEQIPTLNRRLLDLRHIAFRLKRSPMTPLQVCEAIIEQRLVDPEIRTFFSGLPDDERHYWIASLSLETGLLVEGSAALQVARLVDGVFRVARSL